MARRRVPGRALPEHLVRSEEWNGLHPGDPVEIAGAARGATWRFRAHVRNSRNDSESVEVVGGAPGEYHVRSFRPDQVFPPRGRKGKGPSLADAPRLPLG